MFDHGREWALRGSGMRAGAVLLMLGCGSSPALAARGAPGDAGPQGMPQSPSVIVPPSSAPRAPSVIVPHGDIDPGMRVRPPRLSSGTTPVIRPRTTPAPGSNTVVVPR